MDRITQTLIIIFIGAAFVISCRQRGALRDQIISKVNANHRQVLALVVWKEQTKNELLESFKLAEKNRINKGDELR